MTARDGLGWSSCVPLCSIFSLQVLEGYLQEPTRLATQHIWRVNNVYSSSGDKHNGPTLSYPLSLAHSLIRKQKENS